MAYKGTVEKQTLSQMYFMSLIFFYMYVIIKKGYRHKRALMTPIYTTILK